ncbi:MAG: ATP-binding protein [Candidatus Pristimantibacillus sp.]
MSHQPNLFGHIYYELLSLMIICFASYTMFSMAGQFKSKEWVHPISWTLCGSFVFSLGLWAMHVVSLLGSNYLIVLDWVMVYGLIGCVIVVGSGIILLKSQLSLHLKLMISSLLFSIGVSLLHYLMVLSGTIVASEINFYLFSLSFFICAIGMYAALYWLVRKVLYYRMLSSIMIGVSSMAVHVVGMKALKVDYKEILTVDRLNDYLLILSFLLGIAMVLIASFTMTTWYATRKYGIMDARYKLLVENSLDTIALIKDDRWEYINPSGLRMLAVEHNREIVGKSIYDFVDEKDHDEVRNWLHFKPICEIEQQKAKEFQWKTAKGNMIFTEMVRTSTTFYGKNIDQVIIRDITERKKNEELLINSEKLYIAGQLAAGIAHEIRNPLTSLKGFLQLIASGRSNKNYHDIMKSELIRIESIVSEMLMLSKPQIYQLSYQDLRRIMAETVTLLDTEAIMYNIEIELQSGSEALWIVGVENQIKQVFINVIKNAIEVMPGGGLIRINMSLEDSGYIRIQIQDEGPGMEEEQLSKIGQPFYTTKDKGTGLGMMITYKIVDNHQGCVEAYSEAGKGTTFIIQFPYNKDQSELPAAD